MIRPTSFRRIAREISRACALLSAAVLVVGLAVTDGHQVASAAVEDAGAVALLTPSGSTNGGQPLTSGGSATVFAMSPPSGASCPGSAVGTPPYRWQTFMVASSVDASTLTYLNGPVPVGTSFVAAMYSSASSDPVTDKNPSTSPVGLISGIPTFSFAVFAPGDVPAGDYKLGIACTNAGVTEKFWSTQIRVVTAASDAPAQFTWTAITAAPTTTTTTSTTTAASTSTTSGAATSTTVRSGSSTTSTTTAGSTTTVAGVTTTTSGLGSFGTPTTRSGGTLAATGSSSWTLVIWAILLLVFGRIVILLGRKPSAGSPESQ